MKQTYQLGLLLLLFFKINDNVNEAKDAHTKVILIHTVTLLYTDFERDIIHFKQMETRNTFDLNGQ